MSDAILQILLILAYLAIGLISVTFPIYAICVTYLRQEFWEDLKERKKRIEQLKEQISKLTQELSGQSKDSTRFKEIQKQIKKYQTELKEARFMHLTARGAVALPIILLLVSLALTCIGILFFYESKEEWVGFFAGASVTVAGGAIWGLYKTISAVEYAALRLARTIEFRVFYDSGEEIERIKLGEPRELYVNIGTDEAQLDNLMICIFVPPDLELQKVTSGSHITEQTSKAVAFPNYKMIGRERSYLPSAMYERIGMRILSKKTGIYEIPVLVSAKGIFDYETKLVLEVIKKE